MNPNIVKIKKIETATLCLVVAVIIFIMAIFISPFVYLNIKNSTYKRTDSKDDFLNNNYVSYNGGEEAQMFFEAFVNLEGNEEISFKYRDKDNAITLKSATHTIFVLDVKYNSSDYSSHKNNIWSDTNTPDTSDASNYYGSFLMTAVMLKDDIYTDNYCGVFFDDNNYTVRYIFFYNVNRNNAIRDGIKSMIRASISLEWNED